MRRSKAYPAGRWRFQVELKGQEHKPLMGWFIAKRRSTIDTVTDHLQRKFPDWITLTVAAKPETRLDAERWRPTPYPEIT